MDNKVSVEFKVYRRFDFSEVVFSEKSEREAIEISGVSCKEALVTDGLIGFFVVYTSGNISSVGSLNKAGLLVMFTVSEKHVIGYARAIKKALTELLIKRGLIYTYTKSWYKESRDILRFMGFSMIFKEGDFERWALVPKQ